MEAQITARANEETGAISDMAMPLGFGSVRMVA